MVLQTNSKLPVGKNLGASGKGGLSFASPCAGLSQVCNRSPILNYIRAVGIQKEF
jgi:hypothetical protein